MLITQIQANGPADKAGLGVGDLITSINGTAITDPTTLADVIAGMKPGQAVGVTVTRSNGTTQTIQVNLGRYPG